MGVTTIIKDYGTEILNAIRENDLDLFRSTCEKHLNADRKIAKLCISDIKHRPTKKFACPLILAARQNDPRILQYMMEKGVDPNFIHHTIFSSKRKEIITALHISVDLALYDSVEVLLDANADSNISDHNQETPLHLAVKKADRVLTRMLLSRGANPSIVDRKDNAALHISTLYGHLQLTRTLLKYNADVYQKGQMGAIPPHIAAKEGHIHLIQLFCSRDVGNINIKLPCFEDQREKALIHLAAENGHVETVLALLDQFEAEVNLKDSENNNPLHCCVLHQFNTNRMRDKEYFIETAKVLIKFGVSINSKNIFGDTPLHLASMNRFQRIVEILLDVGANPLAENDNRMKPIDVVSDLDPVTKQVLKDAMLNPKPPRNLSRYALDNQSVSSMTTIGSQMSFAKGNARKYHSDDNLLDRGRSVTHSIAASTYSLESSVYDNQTVKSLNLDNVKSKLQANSETQTQENVSKSVENKLQTNSETQTMENSSNNEKSTINLYIGGNKTSSASQQTDTIDMQTSTGSPTGSYLSLIVQDDSTQTTTIPQYQFQKPVRKENRIDEARQNEYISDSESVISAISSVSQSRSNKPKPKPRPRVAKYNPATDEIGSQDAFCYKEDTGVYNKSINENTVQMKTLDHDVIEVQGIGTVPLKFKFDSVSGQFRPMPVGLESSSNLSRSNDSLADDCGASSIASSYINSYSNSSGHYMSHNLAASTESLDIDVDNDKHKFIDNYKGNIAKNAHKNNIDSYNQSKLSIQNDNVHLSQQSNGNRSDLMSSIRNNEVHNSKKTNVQMESKKTILHQHVTSHDSNMITEINASSNYQIQNNSGNFDVQQPNISDDEVLEQTDSTSPGHKNFAQAMQWAKAKESSIMHSSNVEKKNIHGKSMSQNISSQNNSKVKSSSNSITQNISDGKTSHGNIHSQETLVHPARIQYRHETTI